MENYKLLCRAGEGAHGFVFKALDLRTNQIVALKKVTFNPSNVLPKNIMREICALRALKSINIVELFEVTSMGSGVVLVMEFLPCSLTDVLKTASNLSDAQVKSYARMLFSGISFMHANSIMHRDIKPANLLINDHGLLKIADFGLARIYNPSKKRLYSHQVATRWYRAPELLYGSKTYTDSVDVWAAGCIFVEMINGKPLFPGETDIEQLAIVLATLGTPTEETWPDLKTLPDYNKIAFITSPGKDWKTILERYEQSTVDLISHILIYNNLNRLSAAEVLNHRYFSEEPSPAKLSDMPKPKNIQIEEPAWNFEEFDAIFNQIK